jgi:hypothetical protein
MGRQWKEILADAYISPATLHRLRHGDPYKPVAETNSLRSLAHAMHFGSWEDLMKAFEVGDVRVGLGTPLIKALRPGAPPEDPVLSLSKALNLPPTELLRRITRSGEPDPDDPLPRALRMDEMRPARMVPHFLSGVAASQRVEKIEEEDAESKKPVSVEDARVFTIPVDGDCQEPAYKDGEIVVFSFDAYEREGIIPGKSYYLAFTDGSTTFKRVYIEDYDPEVYILRCWNERKYPRQKRVHFSEVVRIARAISKQVVVEE